MDNSEKVLVAVSVAAIGGAGAYLYFKRKKSSVSSPNTSSAYSLSGSPSSSGSSSYVAPTSASTSSTTSNASATTINWTQIGYNYTNWTSPSIYLPSAYNNSSEMVLGPGSGNQPNGVYYLVSYFTSSSGTANLSFMADDGAVVYLDGNKIAASYGCSICSGVPVTANFSLTSGTHLLAVEVANNAGAFGGSGYVTYGSGTPNPTALRLSLTQGSNILLSTDVVGIWKMLAYPSTLLSPNPMKYLGTIPKPSNSAATTSAASSGSVAASTSSTTSNSYDQQISNQIATNQIAKDTSSTQFKNMTNSQQAAFERQVQLSTNEAGQAQSSSSAISANLQIAAQDAQQVANNGQYGSIADGQTVLSSQNGKAYYITNHNGVYYKSLVPSAISPGSSTVNITTSSYDAPTSTNSAATYTTPTSYHTSSYVAPTSASTSSTTSNASATISGSSLYSGTTSEFQKYLQYRNSGGTEGFYNFSH